VVERVLRWLGVNHYELQEHIDKGVTAEQQIMAGRKVKEAGFEFSAHVMPSLGAKKLYTWCLLQ